MILEETDILVKDTDLFKKWETLPKKELPDPICPNCKKAKLSFYQYKYSSRDKKFMIGNYNLHYDCKCGFSISLDVENNKRETIEKFYNMIIGLIKKEVKE